MLMLMLRPRLLPLSAGMPRSRSGWKGRRRRGSVPSRPPRRRRQGRDRLR